MLASWTMAAILIWLVNVFLVLWVFRTHPRGNQDGSLRARRLRLG